MRMGMTTEWMLFRKGSTLICSLRRLFALTCHAGCFLLWEVHSSVWPEVIRGLFSGLVKSQNEQSLFLCQPYDANGH